MPNYYNGKEITTNTKSISGFSLVGKATIKLGGRVITLPSAPPPPSLEPLRLFDGGRIPDPVGACTILSGGGGTPVDLYSVVSYPQEGNNLFTDSGGTTPFNGGNAYYFDPVGRAVFPVDSDGLIGAGFRCR